MLGAISLQKEMEFLGSNDISIRLRGDGKKYKLCVNIELESSNHKSIFFQSFENGNSFVNARLNDEKNLNQSLLLFFNQNLKFSLYEWNDDDLPRNQSFGKQNLI